jgi:hypothetical protein
MLQDKHNPTTPCHKCEKVPVELRMVFTPVTEMRAAAIELTEQNRQAWAFYRQCRAVNHFPEDPLVAWYSEILRGVYDQVERVPFNRFTSAVEALILQLRKSR